MTKQKTITLNLSLQEAESLAIAYEKFSSNVFLNTTDCKPCRPFIDKLLNKLKSSTAKNHPQ
jgi:hypothetical protein